MKRPQARWHWGFGGGWKVVLGVKISRRTVIFELLLGSLRLDWNWLVPAEETLDEAGLRSTRRIKRFFSHMPGRYSDCPYCGHRVADVTEEVEHMETEHPDVIRDRLLRAGLGPPLPGDDHPKF